MMELSGSVYDYLQGIIVCVLLILQNTASTPVSECTVNAVNAVPAVNARRTSASDQVSVMPIHMNPHGKPPPFGLFGTLRLLGVKKVQRLQRPIGPDYRPSLDQDLGAWTFGAGRKVYVAGGMVEWKEARPSSRVTRF